MNVFDFHVGHNIPESKGGKTNINNLKPICARCNLSMGSQYSIEEWSKMGQRLPQKSNTKASVIIKDMPIKKPWWLFYCCGFTA
jgi:5-methylcytosine-specific restriction endonuclease McrA